MPAIDIVANEKAIQYTGSNSAEIDAAITQLSIVSETGGVLTVESPPSGTTWVINTNDWVRYTQGTIASTHSPSAFALFFARNALFDDLADLQDAIDDLGTASLLSAGVKECPTLSPGNTVVSVDLTVAMPDTSYTPHAQVFAPAALLGSVSITGVAVADTNTVDVTINNTGLLGLTGARLLVTVTA